MAIKSEDVAFYLREHPEFFSHYAEFLDHLHFQKENNVVPFSEQNMAKLREQNKRLETKLTQLLTFGEENDKTTTNLHQLAVALNATAHWHAMLQLVDFHLKEVFQVPFVALRIWGVKVPDSEKDLPIFSPLPDELKQHIAALNEPSCNVPSAITLSIWDEQTAQRVQSEALIPLKNEGDLVGVLALASPDATRFYASMGTLYLSRLSELISSALFRAV